MEPCRRLPALAAIVALACAPAFGLRLTGYKSVSSNSTNNGVAGYAVDVNNDGLTDIVQVSWSSPYQITVHLAKGDGSFSQGSTYTLPPVFSSAPPLAFADFNGDGKVDIVAPVAGKNELVVYLGNGNGTFQTVKTLTNVLPSGMDFQNESPLAADFNHDGKIDVAAFGYSTGSGLNNIVLLEGNGNGTFTYKEAVYTTAANYGIGNAVTGDFNSDNSADIAFVSGTTCDSGSCDDVVHVLYGNGNFTFKETTAFSVNGVGSMSLSAGDLNGDGATDLFGYDSATNQLVLLYGHTNDTFTTYYHTLAKTPTEGPYEFVLADFNGDGLMDVASWEYNAGSSNGPASYQLSVFLANGAAGDFTEQEVSLPYYQPSGPLVGNFTGNAIPDLAFLEAMDGAGSYPTTILTEVNNTPGGNWGGCNYPRAGEGVTLCSPSGGTSGNPVVFKAAANSFGDIRKFELWVDGKKLSEQHHSWGHNAWFNLRTSLAAGKHSCTLNVTNIDNDAEKHSFTLTVQ